MEEAGFGARFIRFVVVATVVFFGAAGQARADTQVLEAPGAPIVRVNIRAGNVVVRTWDREAISIDGDASLSIERHPAGASAQGTTIAIPQMLAGNGDVGLPPESFVTAAMPPGPREVVIVKSGPSTPRGPVTVLIPNDTPFVFARAAAGTLDVSDYRGGTLVALARNGRMLLVNDGGTVFAQTGQGPLIVRGSNFDRVRARSLAGNVVFGHCDVRQIEATTIGGSIVFDGGSFAPGLARFESTRGDVAIGATGNLELDARASADGHVFTNFAGRAQIESRGGATNAVIGEGGSVVTAVAQGGSVFLYDGSLQRRAPRAPEWQAPLDVIARPGIHRAAAAVAPGHAPFVPPRFRPGPNHPRFPRNEQRV